MRSRSPLYSTFFSSGLDEPATIRPLLLSSLLAALYVAFCGTYILYSSAYAARLSGTVEQLERIEQLKGIVFVFITGLLFFACAFYLLSALARQNREIIEHKKSIIFTERAYMAGVFASSIAHDVNNMIAAIQGHIELVKPGIKDSPHLHKHLDAAQEATTRLHAMNQRLLSLGRERTPGSRSIGNLVPVLQDVLEFADVHRKVKDCRVTHKMPESLVYTFNPQMIRRCLLNLIINGAEATLSSGHIELRVLVLESSIRIEVHDDGPGVPEELREQILEPFFTTKDTGTGLGLLSLKVCAHEHDATLEVDQSDLGGACFRLVFPKTANPTD